MLQTEGAVSSIVSFETDGTPAWSKMLHNIAHDIQIDGLKIKRIAIFEQPLLARIYIKDIAYRSAKQKRFIDVFKTKANPDVYDYVLCLELQEYPYFKGSCSYKIERCIYFTDIKTPKSLQISKRFEHITHLLSKNILKSLSNAGGRNLGIYKLV